MVKIFFTIPLLCLCLSSAYAQVRTDRERDGFIDQVHTVCINIADATQDTDKVVEKRRGGQDLIVYDPSGKKSSIEAWRGKEIVAKTSFIRDGQGHIAEVITVDPETNEPVGKTIFSYDSKENLIEAITYVSDVLHHLKLGTPETLLLRVVYSYDSKARVSEEMLYGAGETFLGKSVCTYDARGNLISSTEHEPDGSPSGTVTYTYEFDSVGNWIKQSRFEQQTKIGNSTSVPVSSTYRTITYY